jgi:threonine/homoserine/homoserine lactone efflux protein
VNPHLLGLYLVAVFLAMIAPGPDMMFVLAVGARGGPRAGAIFIAFEVLVDGTVGLTAGRLGDWLSRRRRARQAVDIGSGTIMVALAGRLAFEVR